MSERDFLDWLIGGAGTTVLYIGGVLLLIAIVIALSNRSSRY